MGRLSSTLCEAIGSPPPIRRTGPGLLEPLRFGLRRLYHLRLAVDYTGLAISRASADLALQTVAQTLAAIDQHTPGGPL